MQRNTTRLASFVVVAALSGALGCSSTSGPATTGPVSFKTDVMPILQSGCTLSAVCHGQMGNAGEEDLFLGVHQTSLDGTPVDPATAMMVYTGLVGVKSLEDPKMNLVTVMDSKDSYLIHKLNGDQDSLEADCAMGMCNASTCAAPTTCGIQMPMSGSALDPSVIAKIASWIDQGAPNN
jgi:hypothetical protein